MPYPPRAGCRVRAVRRVEPQSLLAELPSVSAASVLANVVVLVERCNMIVHGVALCLGSDTTVERRNE
eukprot:COSAG06_NODE_7529_length_2471_cov_1.391231_2_plen_68_part_00